MLLWFVSKTELIHHVIERLLARKRGENWEDANILTLGYREVAPGAAGHHVTQSNGIMCYYPNTLVATLKKPLWKTIHRLIGDDLMIHILLNFTIFVQLKESPGSYMQLSGKSLRQQKRVASEASVKREVTINQVMYARYFQKNRLFASSHVLVKASKTCDPASRTEACRVLQSIFPDAAGHKRLPKRIINLIPTIQDMVSRFKTCKVDKLVRDIIPLHPDFRKFMIDNPNVKSKIAEKAAKTKASSQPLVSPIVRKALEDGYVSQSEVIAPICDRKRKRREEAIDMLSYASVESSSNNQHVDKRQKTVNDSDRKGRDTHDTPDLTKLQQHKEDIRAVLAFTTSKVKVYRLVRKFVAKVVPKELWGCTGSKNWKSVKVLIRKVIFSRKFDIFSLKKAAEELQVTNVAWMRVNSKANFCPPNERVKRQKLFEDLLWWIMSSLVFPLLQNLFYITETEGEANEVAYYQRPVWEVISTLALCDMEGEVLQLSRGQTSPNSSDCQLATSRLRLLPKSSGIRPLMNLSTAVDSTMISVNRSMEAVHRVLTFEMMRRPKQLLGASVRNIDEIYKRIKPLFREIVSCPRCAEHHHESGDTPMAYCVTVDVERCFDTIRPRKLYQMLKKAIREDEYLIRKHWVGHQIAPVSLSANDEDLLPSSSVFFKLERPAYPSGELLGFDELAAQSKRNNSIFVDGVLYDYLTKMKALRLLKEHLSANTVQIDGQDYIQRCGIPQGSVLSTTLCNLYYAHFERRVLRKRLPEVCDPAIVPTSCCQHEELFRYTDDFMYITSDLKRAKRFFEVMHEGNGEYGCFVNVSKSQANFEVANSGEQVLPEFISWCGMLIDPNELQIYINYDKLNSSLLQGSIPLNETKAAQDFFVNKVISPIRQRWHALYFDPALLSEDTIHINLFQMLVVAAHRFSILIKMLPFVNRDMRFFHECVRQILKKMGKGIHRSLENSLGSSAKESAGDRNHPSSTSCYQMQRQQVWTIGLFAFQLTIRSKKDRSKACKARQVRPQCRPEDWQKLLDALQTEQEEFKRRAKRTRGTGRRSVYDLQWLVQDRRNATVLKQCVHH